MHSYTATFHVTYNLKKTYSTIPGTVTFRARSLTFFFTVLPPFTPGFAVFSDDSALAETVDF